MVECELYLLKRLHSGSGVLIDTWWNVNITIDDFAIDGLAVLIDTWWNVNQAWLWWYCIRDGF